MPGPGLLSRDGWGMAGFLSPCMPGLSGRFEVAAARGNWAGRSGRDDDSHAEEGWDKDVVRPTCKKRGKECRAEAHKLGKEGRARLQSGNVAVEHFGAHLDMSSRVSRSSSPWSASLNMADSMMGYRCWIGGRSASRRAAIGGGNVNESRYGLNSPRTSCTPLSSA